MNAMSLRRAGAAEPAGIRQLIVDVVGFGGGLGFDKLARFKAGAMSSVRREDCAPALGRLGI